MNWTAPEDAIVALHIAKPQWGAIAARQALLRAGFRRSHSAVYERVKAQRLQRIP